MSDGGLRHAALEALGPHADLRARDVLSAATLSVVEGVVRWESSSGTVRGHRVVIALDARRLGLVRGTPRVADEVNAALSVAVGRRAGDALCELVFRWSGASEPRERPYRDAPPPAPAVGLKEALAEYAEGAGETELAGVVARARVEGPAAGARVTQVRLDAGDRGGARSSRVEPFLTRALRDLLADDRALASVVRPGG